MSRTDFLTSPQAWTRTKNIDQSPAQYANAIERPSRGHRVANWTMVAAFLYLVALLIWERMA